MYFCKNSILNFYIMASALKNLSDYQNDSLGNSLDFSKTQIVIVVSEWNKEVTEALYEGAYQTLLKEGLQAENITRYEVSGSYELCLGAQWAAKRRDIEAVICLGCVIQGETRHFDFICQAVADGLMRVSLDHDKPVIFGVLTPNNQEQALDRAGGKHGNKGVEAAATALKMLALRERLRWEL